MDTKIEHSIHLFYVFNKKSLKESDWIVIENIRVLKNIFLEYNI